MSWDASRTRPGEAEGGSGHMRAAVLTASPHKSYLFTHRGSCGERLFAARPGVVGEISTGRSCAYSQLQAETTLFTPQTPHVPDRMCPITPAMAEPKSMPTCRRQRERSSHESQRARDVGEGTNAISSIYPALGFLELAAAGCCWLLLDG